MKREDPENYPDTETTFILSDKATLTGWFF